MQLKRMMAATFLVLVFGVAGCSKSAPPPQEVGSAPKAKLGIRPQGDETIHPDVSKLPADLQKTFAHIDSHSPAFPTAARESRRARRW
jgi:PBP1b-binding outer membrane lipoprotein LpoB